jgi:hypothetical protein
MLLDGVIYTLLELSSGITAHTLPPLSDGVSPRLLASAPTLSNPSARPTLSTEDSTPEVPSVNNALAEVVDLPRLAAEILLPAPNATYPEPYIYVSNRNDPHPDGDIIAVFKPLTPSEVEQSKEPGQLKLIAEIRSGLQHLRGMIFFGPDDKVSWLAMDLCYGPSLIYIFSTSSPVVPMEVAPKYSSVWMVVDNWKRLSSSRR